MISDTRLKIAVFIDFDNIEIGVKSTLGGQFDVGPVLEALKERGEVVSKIAYADWKRAADHSRSLAQHAIKMVQRNLTPGGDKNGADINLALDALEMAFTHDHINAFVIVGGDSDFVTLVEKLKQYDKKVFVVGGRAFTSAILQKNCHEFIAYENLVAAAAPRKTAERGRTFGQVPVIQAFPLVRRALKVLVDREVSPQLGLLKSTLLQLDSTFSERTYGASTFRDFAEKLAGAGLVNLKHAGRNLQVELKDTDVLPPATGETSERAAQAGNGLERHSTGSTSEGFSSASQTPREATTSVPAPEATAPDPERLAEGVRAVRSLIASANVSPRWPMYLRQVKQVLRSIDRTFDERRYGFGNLVDLLRSCQREGLFRLERDRRGVLRVFPGAAMQPAAVAVPGAPLEEARTADEETVEDGLQFETPSLAGAAAFEPDLESAPLVEVSTPAAAMVEEAAPPEVRPSRRRKRTVPPEGKPAARSPRARPRAPKG